MSLSPKVGHVLTLERDTKSHTFRGYEISVHVPVVIVIYCQFHSNDHSTLSSVGDRGVLDNNSATVYFLGTYTSNFKDVIGPE